MASGLSQSEYQRVTQLLGHEPSQLDAGIFGAMWSEHCSYKSSRAHLRKLPKNSPRVLVGPGENAGAVDIGDGLCVVFKVESHNHPSFIEPFQGAATGVGGILRDIFTMGARPIATMNLLRFGSHSYARTPQLVDGAIRGLSAYGNCFGVANVVSDIAFDACYDANILVNAFAIGLCKHEDLQSGVASGVGNRVIYVGAKTGRDGIHGATMASESFDDASHEKRPTVQVGDPFKEKLLLEACLECFEKRLIVGIQDMGAAGLTSSSYEMATRGKSGLALHLDRVPLRDAGMIPYEIMLSESQERMLLVATPNHVAAINEIFARYDLDAVDIGEVTNGRDVELFWRGDRVSALNPLWLTDEAPVEMRPSKAPVIASEEKSTPLPSPLPPSWGERIIGFERYDRHIGLGTLVAGDVSDAALVRIEGTNKAIGLSIACDEKLCAIDPWEGVRRTFARQVLQLACVGAKPIGVTDCLNFGSPEDPEVMWQFEQAIDGLCDAANCFEVPVVSGNVSFYNQTNDKAIYPTPTLGLVGLRDGFENVPTRHLKRADDVVYFIGTLSNQLTGAEDWLEPQEMKSRRLDGWDLQKVKELADLVGGWVNAGAIDTVCAVGDGGIGGTLMRMHEKIPLPPFSKGDQSVELWSEASMGVIVSVPRTRVDLISQVKNLGKFTVVEL